MKPTNLMRGLGVLTGGMGGVWGTTWWPGWMACFGLGLWTGWAGADESFAVPLPEGVRVVWDLDKAHRETTATRERVCLNGLWRWQPASPKSEQAPVGEWGFFKVPGSWPGITDYMQKDCQTVHVHPGWRGQRLGGVLAAWYEREITVPAEWAGRRVVLEVEYLNSWAMVMVDGVRVGEAHFPGGAVDLTGVCRPGAQHRLSLLVVALPLKGVMLSYSDSASAREVQGSVARRGLCGDVYLVGEPAGPRLVDGRVETSVREGSITVDAALDALLAGQRYMLQARVWEGDRVVLEFGSGAWTAADPVGGRVRFDARWRPERLWDTHTPGNVHQLELLLKGSGGEVLDAFWQVRFGFRECWIDGRDFYLNGSRIHLSVVPLDNAQVGAAWANYEAARESFERLQSFGINFVYTHNYGCEPGAHLGFAEVLRAADDTGMLVAFSQPHFSHYSWSGPDADASNGYGRHAAFYVRAAQNHPSVVAYAMSHNATGYSEDMNPDMIDGVQEARDDWARRNVGMARRAETWVARLDPSRWVYHHASGNLGPLHAINFYPNFVPIQEMSDWFEHWATKGVKPVFLCEYAAPFSWDWTLYRGWFRGEREFGSARVPWDFSLAEWNAQFLGDAVFPISEAEAANVRWEAGQFRAGRLWHRWDYPNAVGSRRFDERYPVIAAYLTDNWRAFRTWGVSAVSPWEHDLYWKPRDGVERGRWDLGVDWEGLQRPGFSPDYIDQRYERMDLAFERSDWVATPAAEALLRNNRALLGYLAGKPERFTSKDHNFQPGDVFEKQAVVLNNSRVTVVCGLDWRLELPDKVIEGERRVTVHPGEQARVPLRFDLPDGLAPGRYELRARFAFDTGEVQEDTFGLDVLPALGPSRLQGRVALFDPAGETTVLLARLGVRAERVGTETDLRGYEILVVGKAALEVSAPAPDLRRVRDGLKVIVFEQSAPVLERRIGFRVAEYGLRQVFPRVPDHPVLAGLGVGHLRDWRGAATILEPRLKYELRPRHGPTVEWCGIPVSRLWRCGNQGNVASVLIEKPVCGDFMPLVDGGFSLQYSPLLEYREGLGLVVFCQLDVTGRTEVDPAAGRLVHNLLDYVDRWQPREVRAVWYAGEPEGRKHLEATGVSAGAFDETQGLAGAVLVLGPGAVAELTGREAAVRSWVAEGGRVLAIGLNQDEARGLMPFEVLMAEREHLSTGVGPFGLASSLAGIGSVDLHNRDPRVIPLVSGGVDRVGNGVLGLWGGGQVVLCQMAPWLFGAGETPNVRRTHGRVSYVVTRLLANHGVTGAVPLIERFGAPVVDGQGERRWLSGFYLGRPEEWDDPYRFFRW
jgi:beta-galactosidase